MRRAGLQQVAHNDQARALSAAHSGLAYAKSRLASNPRWRGGSGTSTTIDENALVVVESRGNVHGRLQHPDGGFSEFRIRFNFQDGSDGGDGISDPPDDYFIDHPWVSLNNINKSSPAIVPKVDPSDWRVPEPKDGVEIPPNSVSVSVEGRAGRSGGRISTRVAEKVLKTQLDQPVMDASMMGGGDMRLVAADEVTIENEEIPRLRSKKGIQVRNASGGLGNLVLDNGEVGRDPVFGFAANILGSASQFDEHLGDGHDFYNLPWDDVPKADPDPNSETSAHIPAGIYAFWDDGTLHYYDMELDAYKTFMSNPANVNNPGIPITSNNFSELRSADNLSKNPDNIRVRQDQQEIGISGDVYAAPTSTGTKGIAFIPKGLARRDPKEDMPLPLVTDSTTVQDISFRMGRSVLSSEGDLTLAGSIWATSATFSGPGRFDCTTSGIFASNLIGSDYVNPHGSVNLYFKDDISISSFKGSDFSNIIFGGVVYTWKNFEAKLGSDALSVDKWGSLLLRGTLVAYGADPTSESPGDNGHGEIDITGDVLRIIWTPDALPNLTTLNKTNIKFERSLYREQ